MHQVSAAKNQDMKKHTLIPPFLLPTMPTQISLDKKASLQLNKQAVPSVFKYTVSPTLYGTIVKLCSYLNVAQLLFSPGRRGDFLTQAKD